MSLWLALALQAVPAPAWFPDVCEQMPQTGVAWVELRTAPGRPGPLRPVYFDAAGYPGLQPEDYREALALPPERGRLEADGRVWYPLPGDVMPWRFDACLQVLWMAPRRLPQQLDFSARSSVALSPLEPSLRVNLETFARETSNAPGQFAALFDLGGSLTAGQLQAQASMDDRGELTRLDTVLIRDLPDRQTQLRLGDGTLRADALGTPVRFAGLQVGREFALDPTRNPFPLPALQGEAALPSTLELFVDGRRVRSEPVDPGRFEVLDVPAYSGAGEIQVVVRDVLGRETVYAQPFYLSTQLLREGLTDHTFALGFLRRGFAGGDDRYEAMPFSALRLRHGLSADLTAGLRVESQASVQTAGVSLARAWPSIGVVEAALATSVSPGGSGSLASLSYERLDAGLSLRLGALWSTSDYVELGREPGAIAARYRAQIGLSGPWGSALSLARIVEQRRDREDLGLTALGASLPLSRQAFASVSLLHSAQTGTQATLTFSRALGRHRSSLAQIAQGEGEPLRLQAGVQQGREGPLGWQYRLSAQREATSTARIAADYGGRRGDLQIEAVDQGGEQAMSVSSRTGLVLAGGRGHWSRPLQGSYAVVETGQPGVSVYADHREVAFTGADGRAVVPELRPYEPVRLAIDHRDLPLDQELVADAVTVRPRPGAVRVALAGRAILHRHYRFQLASGDWVPAGSLLRMGTEVMKLPVGYEGTVWLPVPDGPLSVEARWQSGVCRVELSPSTVEGEALLCLPH